MAKLCSCMRLSCRRHLVRHAHPAGSPPPFSQPRAPPPTLTDPRVEALEKALHCGAQALRRNVLDVRAARGPCQRKGQSLKQLDGQHAPGAGQQRQCLQVGAGAGAVAEGRRAGEALVRGCSSCSCMHARRHQAHQVRAQAQHVSTHGHVQRAPHSQALQDRACAGGGGGEVPPVCGEQGVAVGLWTRALVTSPPPTPNRPPTHLTGRIRAPRQRS